MGYEIKTAIRFAPHAAKPGYHMATAHADEGQELLRLTYGNAATIWRINLGWRRRSNRNQYGFLLDTERGYWARNEHEDVKTADAMSDSHDRVIPFVEDRRNSLLI